MGELRDRVSRRLEARRKELHLSREALSKICEIDPQSIRNYEKGDRWPDPEILDPLCKALKIEPWALFVPLGGLTPAQRRIGELTSALDDFQADVVLSALEGMIGLLAQPSRDKDR